MDQTADFFIPPTDEQQMPAADAPIIMGPGDGDFFSPPPMVDDNADFFMAPADSGYIGEVDATEPGAPVPAPAVLVLEDPSQPVLADGYSNIPDQLDGFAVPPAHDGFAVPPAHDGFAVPPAHDGFAVPPAHDGFAVPPAHDGFAVPQSDMGMMPDPEPQEDVVSPMSEWNQAWQVVLRERKDNENALKAEHVESARKDLDTFNEQRYVKREAKMVQNRSEEQTKLEAMEADLENDNSWQRVVKLIDLQQDTIDDGWDVSRMRDVVIMLKNDKTRAAALA